MIAISSTKRHTAQHVRSESALEPSPPPRHQFRLRELCLLIAAVSVAAAITTGLPSAWRGITASGLAWTLLLAIYWRIKLDRAIMIHVTGAFGILVAYSTAFFMTARLAEITAAEIRLNCAIALAVVSLASWAWSAAWWIGHLIGQKNL